MFAKIHEIKSRRLAEPAASVHRVDRVYQLVTNNMKPEHGHHRECYQRFTKNLGRLKASQVVEDEGGPRRRSSTSSSDGIIFSPDCIFCNKTEVKKIESKGVWTSENVSRFEFGGGKAVQDAALRKNDQKLHCRITGLDLFACEAVYHKSCRRDSLRDQTVGKLRSKI